MALCMYKHVSLYFKRGIAPVFWIFNGVSAYINAGNIYYYTLVDIFFQYAKNIWLNTGIKYKRSPLQNNK